METVFEAFAATTDRSPEAPFFCVPAAAGRDYLPGGGEFSYREFFDAALDLAQRYRAAGYGHGHRAALLMENRPEFFQHFLALNVLGVSIVPVNPDYRHDEMLYLLDHSEAEIVVSISSRVGDLESVAAEREKPLPVVDAASLPQTLPPPTRPAPLATQPGRATENARCCTPRVPPAGPRAACSRTTISSTPGNFTSTWAASARWNPGSSASSIPCRSST